MIMMRECWEIKFEMRRVLIEICQFTEIDERPVMVRGMG
jgi:hypothetical protein